MAINFSPRQFVDTTLSSSIANSIKNHGVKPHTVEIEITESILLSGLQPIKEILNDLHEIGVKIVMDDFGTGFSSLSNLHNYPFDMIKIDRSFIGNYSLNDVDKSLIKASVSMAKGLDMEVVVEGVELEEQVPFLKGLGCDFVQGNLFSKPINDKLMSTLLEAQKTDVQVA